MEKIHYGIAIHVNIFTLCSYLTILASVHKLLAQMVQYKHLAGLILTVMTSIQKLEPNTMGKLGNFLIFKKEYQLKYITSIKVQPIMKPGIFQMLQIDMQFWLIVLTCLAGLMQEALYGLDQILHLHKKNQLIFQLFTKKNQVGISQEISVMIPMDLRTVTGPLIWNKY